MERLRSNRVLFGLAAMAGLLMVFLALVPRQGSQAASDALECPDGIQTETDFLYAEQSDETGVSALEQDPVTSTRSLLGTELLPDLDANSDVVVVHDDEESVVAAVRPSDGHTAALVTFASQAHAGWILEGLEACA